jgi:DNA-binding PadR family transcriptional regulator
VPRNPEDPKWSDPGLLVLASLADGPRHGLGILEDVRATSEVKLGPGTLYGVIARLEARGLIERLEDDDARRRPYRLTDAGAAALESQLVSMARFVTLGRERLTNAGVKVRYV